MFRHPRRIAEVTNLASRAAPSVDIIESRAPEVIKTGTSDKSTGAVLDNGAVAHNKIRPASACGRNAQPSGEGRRD